MENEYIIINKTKVLNRIEEIHNERKKLNTGNLHCQEARGQLQVALNILGEILSQSTPLIPEIKTPSMQLDIFTTQIDPKTEQKKFVVTWEYKCREGHSLSFNGQTTIRQSVPLNQDEMHNLIDYLKSTLSYCGWHMITKKNPDTMTGLIPTT